MSKAKASSFANRFANRFAIGTPFGNRNAHQLNDESQLVHLIGSPFKSDNDVTDCMSLCGSQSARRFADAVRERGGGGVVASGARDGPEGLRCRRLSSRCTISTLGSLAYETL